MQFKRVAKTQQNVFQTNMTAFLNGLDKDKEEDTKKAESYENTFAAVSQSWNNLQNQAGNLIRMIADGCQDVETLTEISDVFALLDIKSDTVDGVEKYTQTKYENKEGENQYKTIAAAQKNAVAAQKKVSEVEKELFDKKEEYNSTVSG